MEYFILNNGLKIPAIGLGTFKLSKDEAYLSVKNALNYGYRLIDTANFYLNENSVGKAINESNITRKDIFLETKIWPTSYEDNEVINKTLKRLNVDYIDLVLLHQPCGNYISGYKILEKAYKEGKIKAIGLSNFNETEIEEILSICEIKPVLLQVECHPFAQNIKLNEYLKSKGMILQSWFPFGGKGNNNLLNNEVILDIAKKHNKTAAQIILKWNVLRGYIPVPGSTNSEHIKSNIDIFNFDLDKKDMEMLINLNTETQFHPRSEESLKRYMTLKMED